MGLDNTLTLDMLKEYVAQEKTTYFLVSDDNKNNSDIIDYVNENTTLIDESEYNRISKIEITKIHIPKQIKIHIPKQIMSHNKLYHF